MLINKHTYGYSRNKRLIMGRGYVDTMSSVFNSLKATAAPAFRSIGSYVSTNKNLIAKPLLGAIGSLAAKGLSEGVPALISHIANRNRSRGSETKMPDDPKYKEIFQSMMITLPETTPVTNIIGSGIRRRGAGIKAF